jgi:hypothetical protein
MITAAFVATIRFVVFFFYIFIFNHRFQFYSFGNSVAFNPREDFLKGQFVKPANFVHRMIFVSMIYI